MLVLSALAAVWAYVYQESIPLIYPYLYMINGDRDAAVSMWAKHAPIDTSVTHHPTAVPEIEAKDYTFDALRRATNDFRTPAVVRGLFNGTRAVTMWNSRDYLPNAFGDVEIPVVRDGRVGTLQDDRVVETFKSSFEEVYDAEYSKKYLFFPVKSRFTFNGSDAGRSNTLQETCDRIAQVDLELSRIRPGFGGPDHSGYQSAQYVIGKSSEELSKQSTGSDWHCAVGNNYFIQAVGRKQWDFIDPQYSHMLWPLKGGMLNMWTGNKNIAEVEKHIPRYSTILRAGDMVYNPVWMWHKVKNFGGLSIGVPVRERAVAGLRRNMMFSFIVFSNMIMSKLFGVTYNGYPPPSAATEADN